MLGYIPISTAIEGAPVDDIAYVVKDLAEELLSPQGPFSRADGCVPQPLVSPPPRQHPHTPHMRRWKGI
uniref:Uncharacterized protein n=1 Tax=Thermofilum pendens TaxID=2269 RepID=A0A7C3WT03_THEPE